MFLSIGRRQTSFVVSILKSERLTSFSSANSALELLREGSVHNYLVPNIITNMSIVSNPYKYVILREL